MTTVARSDEALRVAEDVADLITLAQEKKDDAAVIAVVMKVLDRHSQGERSAVPLAQAALVLEVSPPTVRLWMERGVLEQVSSRPHKVSSVSLGRALALIRQLHGAGQGRERLLRALETLRDRDLLARARKAADETGPEDFIVYDQTALAELRRG